MTKFNKKIVQTQNYMGRPSKTKYNAISCEIDGIKFDSKKEGKRYQELKLLEKYGKIKKLKLQPKFELQEHFKYKGKTEKTITYVADFMYYDVEKEKYIVEDVKSYITEKNPVYRIKRKMFLYKYGNNYEFMEVI